MSPRVSAEELREFIRAQLQLPTLDPESGMGRIRQWDSQAQVELVTALEEHFAVTMPFDRMAELTTVAALVDYFRQTGLVTP